MATLKSFSAPTEDELWQQVAQDMARQGEMLQYAAQLHLGAQPLYFDIDIDLGGGFESGFSTTSFLVPIAGNPALRFHLHRQDWVNELGKVFGLEDVTLGYPHLDEAFIIKTNQPETLRMLFADPALRAFLLRHPDCELELKKEDEETGLTLIFTKDDAILDVKELQEVSHWLLSVVQKLSA